ncbi:LysR substrate-binding domain-containing protein [Marinomonas algicola]|uniref:LysR substrate-binding domain-containing protein n=1 Tax=Marinomonas algicola TaxID=2773454 RepID=UPI0017480116|nr:LysR substrate-binding domain-containing protein [Marinomonas algicola]
MDTTLLQTFVEVSKTRNFGQASINLNVSSSTVSARIKQLESIMGVSLFIRRHHEISLTPSGEGLERHANFILKAWERAYEDTALSQRHHRRLVVAAVSSLWDIFVQDWLNDIHISHKELSLRAEESTPLRVVEKLDQSLIDVGFMYEPPSMKGLIVQQVAMVPMILVSDKQGISTEKAVAEGYIRVEWGTAFAVMHESHFPQRPLARVRVNSGRVALSLILNNGGAAYLPDVMVKQALEVGQLHQVVDAPVIEMRAFAAYKSQGEHSALIKSILAKI